MTESNRVQWVYSSRNNRELAERYDQWAKDYETNLKKDFQYRGPQVTAGYIEKYISKEAKILDAGAGTGLMGEILNGMGYKDLTAMDLSQGMLDEAGKKGAYRELHQMVMGETLDFAADSFDAVVSVGVLTVGHAPASSFDELIRITRPEGYIIFTLRPDVYHKSGFKEKQAALESMGIWKLVEVSEKFQTLPKGEPEVFHQVWVYRVTS
ncbi:MAG TPA: class I SAM-dependent methyltransferase [Dehalococcoidia bacterium]|nr:class I SAM-dependent methyltransferase [Dehalococcoidia bacterium]